MLRTVGFSLMFVRSDPLVDGLMNANSATKPRMMPIKNLAKNGPVGVLKRCCTMGPARIYPWRRMRRSRAPSSGLDKFFAAQFSAGYITNMFEFDLRQAHNVRDTKWDQLQRLYFLGYAMWNYLAAPFIFVRDGFDIQELAPHNEDGQRWRVLQVRYPKDIPTYCDTQQFYFDTNRRRFAKRTVARRGEAGVQHKTVSR